MNAYTHGGWGTPTTSQYNILTRKNCTKRSCAPNGIRTSNLWSWSPLELEAEALPIEPLRLSPAVNRFNCYSFYLVRGKTSKRRQLTVTQSTHDGAVVALDVVVQGTFAAAEFSPLAGTELLICPFVSEGLALSCGLKEML